MVMASFEEYEKNIDAFLRDANNTKPSLDILRSGSAPPTVEGSRAAIGSLFGHVGNEGFDDRYLVPEEAEICADPAYSAYYSTNRNLNPRLPPPSVSKDWLLDGGTVGDRRRIGTGDGGGSLFSLQPPLGFSAENEARVQRGRNDLLGARRRSFADVLQLQAEQVQSTPIIRPISRPASRNTFDNDLPGIGVSDQQHAKLHNGVRSPEGMQSGGSQRLPRVQSLGSSIHQSYASCLDASLARSLTPDPQVIRRSPSPCLPPVGSRICSTDRRNLDFNSTDAFSPRMTNCSDMTAALAGLNLSKRDGENGIAGQHHLHFTNQSDRKTGDLNQYMQHNLLTKSEVDSCGFPPNNGTLEHNLSKLTSNGHVKLSNQLSSNDLYALASGSSVGPINNYQNDNMSHTDFTGSNSDAYAANHAEQPHLSRVANTIGSGLKVPTVDPLYMQYLRDISDSTLQASGNQHPSLRNYNGASHMDFSGYPKAYLEQLMAQQKLQYGMPFMNKSRSSNHLFYESSFAPGMQYPASRMPSTDLPFLGTSVDRPRQNGRVSHFSSLTKGGSVGPWIPENSPAGEGYASLLLEEFKINKTMSFKLSEIVNHVFVFSADQYGSRFIQQQLETASIEEKNLIFPEILHHARPLMTDVFGNYVIQKFFEHGTKIQRRELADQLTGHVLPLSLQMYGCRVIQKALEVVDVDQQTQIVSELDGSVLKCVRDQNGNHVIQKCIECVPQEKITFIISAFHGQVLALSTHPYGCRVIQRVLEHCDDEKTQSIMVEEILDSVCTLAQDQYGNYVVQHVLQHGKPEERSAIISKLAGQIVKMSQQKYASNVIEKSLTYGSIEERQLLIDEMLGSTDENEPLQAMMKDQYANYVVQKVLEICDDRNRELILSRIRVHLNVLKKYTYGKHIVPRVEKLLLTGERHGKLQQYSS